MKKRMKYALIMLVFIIIASTTKAYAVAGKVNQETVRMRKEASTESSIVTLISLNEDVEIISEDGEWYKVKYKDNTGYIRKDMVSVDEKVETKKEEENKEAENTASEENKLEENNQTTSSEENKVEDNKDTSNEEQNTEITTGYTGKISSKIDLKIVPSITSTNIHSLDENTQITVKDTINKWSYIEADNKAGWVLTSKIKVEEEKKEEEKQEQTSDADKKEENQNENKEENKEENKSEEKKTETTETDITKYVSTETLNMRETADNNAKLVSQLKINTKVRVIGTEGTWSKIKVNGKTGYVASKYLSDKKVDVTSRSEETKRGSKNTSSETKTSNKTESTASTQSTSSSSSSSGSGIVACAKQYLGCRYVAGGSSPSTGFDCSGFTSYVYKQCGISINRSSGAQASNGTAVSKSNLQPGDLVLFNNRANTSIGHVGIYIGGNTFIHAGNSKTGVITTSLSDSYYAPRFVTARRVAN